MKYVMLMYADPEISQKFTPEQTQAIQKDWFAFMGDANKAGVLLSNNGLAPATNATTIRVREDKTLITDGPFAETHEQMGGFAVLQCSDLDEAVKWAAKIPFAKYGSVEVRPLWEG